MAIFPATAIPSAAADFTLDQSLKFNNDADSAYLSKTFASAGNQKTWSYSVWFKIGKTETGDSKMLFGGVNENNHLRLDNQQRLQIYAYIPSVDYGWISAPQLRDSSAWYHALFVTDTTNATAAQRQRIYLNGVELTDRAVDYGNPPEDYDGLINSAAAHEVGGNVAVSNEYWDGYMAEVHFIDGTALTPTSFGETGDYGEWKPIEVSGLTYGTNGFYLSFAGGGIMSATGGTITTDGDYKVNSFTADGTFTPSADGYVEYLVIAGGGAGAADGATTRGNGAGGAGGYRTGYLAVTASTAYSITVGDGGVGALSANSIEGDDSVFSSITSAGGGGGGWYTSTPGEAGGSGGGGAPPSAAGGAASPAGQGYAGEAGDTNLGGGGGGAGEAGGTDGAGQGGDGLASSITGSSVTRAGGGGGSQASGGAKAGGDGGGGAGGNGGAGTSGTANTGGGGGGGVSGGVSGSGGSGIVIIRYKFQ